VQFESLGAVSYSSSITMAASVAVCEIFSVKEWCDLEKRVIENGAVRQTMYDFLLARHCDYSSIL